MNTDEIEARANAATEGPWKRESESRMGSYGIHNGDPDDLFVEVDFRDDAEFIANARKDVPALLAPVREQKARLDAVRDLANWAGKHGWTLDAAAIRKALEATA